MPSKPSLVKGNDVPYGKSGLDAMNRAILAELTAVPRLSAAELGRRVGLSPPAVREGVSRLEESGVIRGYRLDVDPAAVGLPVAAWVRVRPGPGQLARTADLADRIPEISQCYRISGEDCLLFLVHGPDLGSLAAVLDQFLQYGQTTTSVVVATPVPVRPVSTR